MIDESKEIKTQDNGGDVIQPNGSSDSAGHGQPVQVLPSTRGRVVLGGGEAKRINENNNNSTPEQSLDKVPPTEITAEDKELKEALIPFEKYPKLKKWVELFTDKDNKATYGNRTESAMQAYNCKDRVSASQVGAQNFRKLKGLTSMFAEHKGVTFEKLLETIFARALTSERKDWMELALEMTDYRDPRGINVNVVNNTQNNTQVNVSGAEVTDFDAAFKDFLKHE